MTTSKIILDRLLTRYVDQYYAADKKANDAGRGCAPGCAHCMCPLDNRLKLPWSLDRPPDTWDDADAACEAICVHRNPEYELLVEAAHEHEINTFCRFCKRIPYRTEAERDAARARIRALVALTTAARKQEYAKVRKAH